MLDGYRAKKKIVTSLLLRNMWEVMVCYDIDTGRLHNVPREKIARYF